MPKALIDVRKFLETVRRPDAKKIIIKSCPGNVTKFKIRTSRYLYTLRMKEPSRAKRLKESLPPGVVQEVVGKKNKST